MSIASFFRGSVTFHRDIAEAQRLLERAKEQLLDRNMVPAAGHVDYALNDLRKAVAAVPPPSFFRKQA